MRTDDKNGKKVSLLSAIFISTTCMIGSGWLFSAQLSAHYAGNWSFAAWIMAALMILAVTFCYNPVVKKFPVRGAVARCGALSHNRIFGLPFSFASWFGILAIIPSEAQATTQYLASAIGSEWLSGPHGLTIYGKLIAVMILGIYVLINFYGVKFLSRVNNTITAFKVLTPLFIIAIFMIAVFESKGTGNFKSFSGGYGIKDAFMALVGAGLIYSFNGFQVCLAFASETKNPGRTIPLAIFCSVLIVLALYMLLQFAFMGAIPASFIAKSGGWEGLGFSSPLLNLSMMLGYHFVSVLLVVDSVISPSGAGYTYLGGVTRMASGMSQEGQLPGWLGKIDKKYHFSRRSLLFNAVLALIMLTMANSWAALMVLTTGYGVIGYMAAPVSMGAITKSGRIPGMIVFVLLSLLFGTLSDRNMLFINTSITMLVLFYGVFHVKGVRKVLLYSGPFIAYLWLLSLCSNVYTSVILSMVFYWFVTKPSYVSRARDEIFLYDEQEQNSVEPVPEKVKV